MSKAAEGSRASAELARERNNEEPGQCFDARPSVVVLTASGALHVEGR
ncbi:MAG: hypothetical protein MUC96_00485 [Myxococcaceae bacterium]|jgi:hypothetical protein|nr:hypothetical protein [Myxococcaceae bacterium]